MGRQLFIEQSNRLCIDLTDNRYTDDIINISKFQRENKSKYILVRVRCNPLAK
jgi:hypothetical protein